MKRILLFLVLILFAFPMLPSAAEEPIRIGAVFSVTGPASYLGEPEKNTLRLALERINAQGGVLGRKLEIVDYDDETDVNKCVLSTDKLIKKDKVVAVIGPTTSGNTLAITGKFAPAKIPLLSCAAAEKITTPVTPWVFKVAPSDRFAAMRILQDAQRQGYKKIAIITASDGFGQAGRAVLAELIPSMGFSLAADELFNPSDTDMTAQLTKIKSLSPDAIICWGTGPGPAVITRNRSQLGIATPLYQSHGVASKKFIELAGESAEGVLFPASRIIVAEQIPDSHPQKPVLLQYIKDYTTRYNQDVSTFGGHAWDALNLVVKAIEMGGSADPKSIRDNLEKIQGFVGTAGTFNFSPKDHNGLDESAFVLIRIQNSSWTILQQ